MHECCPQHMHMGTARMSAVKETEETIQNREYMKGRKSVRNKICKPKYMLMFTFTAGPLLIEA